LGKLHPDIFKTERLVYVGTDGQTDMARSTLLVKLINSSHSFRDLSVHPDRQTNIYTLWGRKRLLHCVANFWLKSLYPLQGYKKNLLVFKEFKINTRKNAIVKKLDYQIPVTQLKGQKGNVDTQAVKRDWNAPPTPNHNIWLCGR